MVSRIRFVAAGRVGSIELLDAQDLGPRPRDPRLAGIVCAVKADAKGASTGQANGGSWG